MALRPLIGGLCQTLLSGAGTTPGLPDVIHVNSDGSGITGTLTPDAIILTGSGCALGHSGAAWFANNTVTIDSTGHVVVVAVAGDGSALTGLTKSQVGLSSVENTALSTWTGTTNLTTLGTVVTGTWHGTAVADGYIASAATWNAKQNALTAGTDYLTPSGNGSALTALTAANIAASSTAGRNTLNVTNPGAISFLKFAADNSVSTRTPAQVLSDIGAQASGSYAASGANGDITSLTAVVAATTTNLVKPIARQTFSNAPASVTAGNNVIEQTGTMSASRPLTLAAANAYTAGDIVKIVDKSCTVTIANTIVITRAGSDTINSPGTAGATTLAINNPGGSAWIESDGVSQWTLIAGNPGTLTLGSGTVAAPAINLRNYSLFEDTVTVGGLATWAGGNTLSIINGASYRVQNGCSFQWSSTSAALGSADTGLSRDAAGVVDFDTGTAGNKAGSWKATNGTLTGTCRLGNFTVAGLPSASTSGAGATAFVTDSSTTLALGLGIAVTGGGSNKVPVYSDGTSWLAG